MNTEDSILSELEEILFGRMRFEIMYQKMEQEGKETFEPFWGYPESLDEYLEIKSKFLKTAKVKEEQSKEKEWLQSLYNTTKSIDEDTHVLTRLYRIYTRCESFRLLHKFRSGIDELETTLLSYMIVEAQEGIIILLREAIKRRLCAPLDLNRDLEMQCMQIVFNELLACLLDLELSVGHLIKDRIIGYEKLFIHKLDIGKPEIPGVYLTAKGAECRLQQWMVSEKNLQKLETELQRQYEAIKECSESNLPDAFLALDILEAGWVFGKLCLIIDSPPFLVDQTFEDAGHHINSLSEEIINNEASQEMVKGVFKLKKDPSCMLVFKEAEHTNAARVLLGRGRTNKKGSYSDDENRKRSPLGPSSKDPMEEYVHLYEVVDKLDVDKKTLSKYLKEAEIEVVVFSQKTQMIHRGEVQKLIEHYKEVQNK